MLYNESLDTTWHYEVKELRMQTREVDKHEIVQLHRPTMYSNNNINIII
jgi:hypothetical protein